MGLGGWTEGSMGWGPQGQGSRERKAQAAMLSGSWQSHLGPPAPTALQPQPRLPLAGPPPACSHAAELACRHLRAVPGCSMLAALCVCPFASSWAHLSPGALCHRPHILCVPTWCPPQPGSVGSSPPCSAPEGLSCPAGLSDVRWGGERVAAMPRPIPVSMLLPLAAKPLLWPAGQMPPLCRLPGPDHARS